MEILFLLKTRYFTNINQKAKDKSNFLNFTDFKNFIQSKKKKK